MLVDVSKVLLRLCLVRGTQTLVVLDGPTRRGCLFPGLVLWHREEGQLLFPLACLFRQSDTNHCPCHLGAVHEPSEQQELRQLPNTAMCFLKSAWHQIPLQAASRRVVTNFLTAHLHNGGDELLDEAVDLEQGGVEVVQEVYDEALDVRTIVILIRHDHEMPVAQLLGALVALHQSMHKASASAELHWLCILTTAQIMWT